MNEGALGGQVTWSAGQHRQFSGNMERGSSRQRGPILLPLSETRCLLLKAGPLEPSSRFVDASTDQGRSVSSLIPKHERCRWTSSIAYFSRRLVPASGLLAQHSIPGLGGSLWRHAKSTSHFSDNVTCSVRHNVSPSPFRDFLTILSRK